jgi:hypothetical protein
MLVAGYVMAQHRGAGDGVASQPVDCRRAVEQGSDSIIEARGSTPMSWPAYSSTVVPDFSAARLLPGGPTSTNVVTRLHPPGVFISVVQRGSARWWPDPVALTRVPGGCHPGKAR